MANGVTVNPAHVWQLVGSHTQNTSLSSAVTITISANVNALLMGAQTQNVLYTLDGTMPTATKGFVLVAGAAPTLVPVVEGQTVKVIEATASAKLDYQMLKIGG